MKNSGRVQSESSAEWAWGGRPNRTAYSRTTQYWRNWGYNGRHLLFPTLRKPFRRESAPTVSRDQKQASRVTGPLSPLDGYKLSANGAGLGGMPCYIRRIS